MNTVDERYGRSHGLEPLHVERDGQHAGAAAEHQVAVGVVGAKAFDDGAALAGRERLHLNPRLGLRPARGGKQDGGAAGQHLGQPVLDTGILQDGLRNAARRRDTPQTAVAGGREEDDVVGTPPGPLRIAGLKRRDRQRLAAAR